MRPPAEVSHWLFATGFLILGLCLLAETIVGTAVWRRRAWRAYLWPAVVFLLGLFLWPVTVLFTSSALHMLAHSVWANVTMLAGAVQLALVRGKLQSRNWELMIPLALVVGGVAFLVHEQNSWLFSRSAFLHHLTGWLVIVCAVFPLGRVFRPRSVVFSGGYALTIVALAVLLYCSRDSAPIFGHYGEVAGAQAP